MNADISTAPFTHENSTPSFISKISTTPRLESCDKSEFDELKLERKYSNNLIQKLNKELSQQQTMVKEINRDMEEYEFYRYQMKTH